MSGTERRHGPELRHLTEEMKDLVFRAARKCAHLRVSTILLVIGISLSTVAFAQYAYMYIQQQELRREWMRAAASQKAANPFAQQPEPGTVPGLTRIIIPKLQVDDVVVKGTKYRDLLVGPGLLEGTPLPGEPGNSVVAGHRDTFFRHVGELSKGDEILVRRDGHEYRFHVTRKQIVLPSDTSVLDNTPDPELTLVTCYPTYWIGPAPKRLIIQARLATPAEANPNKPAASATN